MAINIDKFVRTSLAKAKAKLPLILTIGEVVGIGISFVATVHAASKAQLLINEAEMLKNDDLTRKEKIKTTWRCYIPPLIMDSAVVACIVYSYNYNRKRELSMLAAYITLHKQFQTYRDRTNRTTKDKVAQMEVDEELEKNEEYKNTRRDLLDLYHDETRLFYIDSYDKFFERTYLQVLDAELKLNRQIVMEGFATVNDFLRLLNLDETKGGAMHGWGFGTSWVDFDHVVTTTDDGLECCVIIFEEVPTINYDLPF